MVAGYIFWQVFRMIQSSETEKLGRRNKDWRMGVNTQHAHATQATRTWIWSRDFFGSDGGGVICSRTYWQ